MSKLVSAAAFLWNRYKTLSIDLARIETAKAYLKTIQIVRLAAIGIYALFIFIGITFAGIAMLHVWLYMAAADKLKAVAVLAAIDWSIILAASWMLFSQKTWMKYSHSYEQLMSVEAADSD